jgi:hypothetical protein
MKTRQTDGNSCRSHFLSWKTGLTDLLMAEQGFLTQIRSNAAPPERQRAIWESDRIRVKRFDMADLVQKATVKHSKNDRHAWKKLTETPARK